MINTTLGDVLNDIGSFSWNECVYLKSEEKFAPSMPCLVINDNEAELGSDDFTPLEAEKRQLSEFLSIQDLKDIIEYLERDQIDPSIETKCAAAAYYFKNDAFMPKPTKSDIS